MDLPLAYRDVPFNEQLFTVPNIDWMALYGLYDPSTGDLRYIGITTNPRRRRTNHTGPAFLRKATPKNEWVRSLLARGMKPEMRIILWVPADGWEDVEREAIADALSKGHDLTNIGMGGRGCRGYRHSPELQARISGAIRDAWTDERRARQSERRTGYKHTHETREKIAEAHRGKPRPPSVIEALSAANRGRKITDETKDKIAATKRQLHGLTAFGETRILSHWLLDPRCMVSVKTLKKGLREGLSLEDAMTAPRRPRS